MGQNSGRVGAIEQNGGKVDENLPYPLDFEADRVKVCNKKQIAGSPSLMNAR
jgi:hypothetical protein